MVPPQPQPKPPHLTLLPPEVKEIFFQNIPSTWEQAATSLHGFMAVKSHSHQAARLRQAPHCPGLWIQKQWEMLLAQGGDLRSWTALTPVQDCAWRGQRKGVEAFPGWGWGGAGRLGGCGENLLGRGTAHQSERARVLGSGV